MKPSYFIPALALLLGGCTTTQTTATHQPTGTKTHIAGTTLPAPKRETVRHSEKIKGYPAGRYQDPNNAKIMHEAHTLYRVEAEPRWNLNPNEPVTVPLGPAVAVSDPRMPSEQLIADLQDKMEEQQNLLHATTEQNERLGQELEKIQQALGLAKKAAASNEDLKKVIATKSTELEETQKRLSQLQTDIAALEQKEQQKAKAAAAAKKKSSSSWWPF